MMRRWNGQQPGRTWEVLEVRDGGEVDDGINQQVLMNVVMMLLYSTVQ
jgi:hypothetical protein